MDKIVLNTELYSSKNSRKFVRNRRTGQTFIVKSARAQQQEKVLDALLNQNKEIWYEMVKEKKYPLRVGFYIYRKTRMRWDWVNIIQGLADAMVKAGYIEDDSAFYFTPYFIGWDIDKNNPRVEITVL